VVNPSHLDEIIEQILKNLRYYNIDLIIPIRWHITMGKEKQPQTAQEKSKNYPIYYLFTILEKFTSL